MGRCRLNAMAYRTCVHHLSKIGLVQALLALFLFDFMIPQVMSTAFAAASESIQPPSAAVEVMRTVLNWLECEECIDGELKAVIRLHKIAVPPLSSALREGPSRSSRETYRNELIVSYTRMANYLDSKTNKLLAMTLDEYIAHHLGNYVRLYQVRALTALSMIGGTETTAALEDALQAPLPREIENKVRDSLTRRDSQNTRTQ